MIDNTQYQASDDDQSIAGVFWKKEAVCAGYAGAVQYLLERIGVPCIYVDGSTQGSTEGHAWNIVKLDGEYYYVDATNGDQPDFLNGNAAQLEWKIPPVVVPVVFYVIEKKLFVDLGKCQKNTAGKEQMQTERFGARPQFPCGKGSERDADQHKY